MLARRPPKSLTRELRLPLTGSSQIQSNPIHDHIHVCFIQVYIVFQCHAYIYTFIPRKARFFTECSIEKIGIILITIVQNYTQADILDT